MTVPSDADGEKPEALPAMFRERSGVMLTIEPSKALLHEIDRFCEMSSRQRGDVTSREAALVFFAITGVMATKAVGGAFKKPGGS